MEHYLRTLLSLSDGVPGIVMVIHAFGDYARHHNHLHAIVADGLFRPNGTFYVAPQFDTQPLEEIFRAKVLGMFKREGEIPSSFQAGLSATRIAWMWAQRSPRGSITSSSLWLTQGRKQRRIQPGRFRRHLIEGGFASTCPANMAGAMLAGFAPAAPVGGRYAAVFRISWFATTLFRRTLPPHEPTRSREVLG